jgi:hypothetical protein
MVVQDRTDGRDEEEECIVYNIWRFRSGRESVELTP